MFLNYSNLPKNKTNLCKKLSAYYIFLNVKHTEQDAGKCVTLGLESAPGIYWSSIYYLLDFKISILVSRARALVKC